MKKLTKKQREEAFDKEADPAYVHKWVVNQGLIEPCNKCIAEGNVPSGVQGNWIRIQPEHEASFIPQPDSLIQVGVILGAGSKSIYKNNVGDKIVVRDWMVERPTVYEETRFYTTDENVLDIL